MFTSMIAAMVLGPSSSPGMDLRHVDAVTLAGREYLRIEGRANEFDFGGQSDATLAVLADGRFALAWESRRQNRGLPGVFVRAFDRSGAPLTAERQATSRTDFNQTRGAAVIDGRGRPAAFFESLYRDGSMAGVFLGDRQASARSKGEQSMVASARLDNGHVAAAYVSEIGRDDRRVFVRLFGADGRAITGELRASDAREGQEVVPSVTATRDGFVAAWQRFDADRKMDGIWAQRFDRKGRRVGNPIRIAGQAAMEPSIAEAGGSLVAAWVEARGNEFVVLAGRFDRELRPIGEASPVQAQQGSQNAAAVAGRSDGGYVVAWNLRTASDVDVYAQTFGPQASPAFRVNRVEQGKQEMSEATGRVRVAYDASTLTVAWSGDAGLGDDSAAHYTRFVAKSSATNADALLALNDRTLANVRSIELARKSAADRGENRHTAEIARPHVPPTFDPRRAESPWLAEGMPRTTSGFTGILNTGWTPPDPHLAVGPSHLLGMTNGAIAWWTLDGTRQFQQPIEGGSGFWGSLGATGFVFDPEAFYDTLSGRFIAMAAEGNVPGNRSFVLFAISDDSDPNGTWYKYRIETTALAGNLFDSPNIGVDRDVLYVTGDGFGRGSNYPVYTFDKASLLRGDPPAISRSTTLTTSTQSAGIPTVQDGDNRAYYLLEHQEGFDRAGVSVIALTNPLDTISFQRFTLPVPSYSNPGPVRQGGTSTTITSFDARFWSLKYSNGFLWATHHVNNPIEIRWYQIALNGWPFSGNNPSLVQSGAIGQADGFLASFSAIAVDGAGNAALTYARSSESEFLSMELAWRKASDPLGTMPNRLNAKRATGPYNNSRWGDYAAIDPDPTRTGRFWGHHEWSEGSSWRTWLQRIDVGADTPFSPNDVQVTRGQLESGGLSEILGSDDRYLVVQQRPPFSAVDPSVGVVVTGVAPGGGLAGLAVTVESQCSAAPSSAILQTVELFNWSANRFERIGERTPRTSDATITLWAGGGNPGRFVEAGTQRVRTRLSWFDRGALAPNWAVRIDQVGFIASL